MAPRRQAAALSSVSFPPTRPDTVSSLHYHPFCLGEQYILTLGLPSAFFDTPALSHPRSQHILESPFSWGWLWETKCVLPSWSSHSPLCAYAASSTGIPSCPPEVSTVGGKVTWGQREVDFSQDSIFLAFAISVSRGTCANHLKVAMFHLALFLKTCLKGSYLREWESSRFFYALLFFEQTQAVLQSVHVLLCDWHFPLSLLGDSVAHLWRASLSLPLLTDVCVASVCTGHKQTWRCHCVCPWAMAHLEGKLMVLCSKR